MAIEEFESGTSGVKKRRPKGKALYAGLDVYRALTDKLGGFDIGCCVNYTILPLLYTVLLYLFVPVRVIIG